MKRLIVVGSLLGSFIETEDILVRSKKQKSESVSKIKEQIASDLEEILYLSTKTIKQLTAVIDDAIVNVKQLAGQESGTLASADKKRLEQCRHDICRLKKVLHDLDGQCCLAI